MRLDGKTAVITGGAGGIGRAAATLFATEGANVLVADVSQDTVDRALADIALDGVTGIVADVTSANDNDRMFATAEERFGGVDVFVANAGIEGAIRPLVDYPDDVFDRVLAVNVKGVWLGLKAAIPAMVRRGGGSIVITSSVAGMRGSPNIAAYVTSKHAVVGLMRTAARECAPLGIRVNTVNPSPVETRMMRSLEAGLAPDAPEQAREMISAGIPMGRYADPDEVARLMLFLASDESSWVTGAVHAVDGGLTA